MKNSAGCGGCYLPRPKAEVDDILRDLQNSSYPTKAEFNNSFIIHSKYFQTLQGENDHSFSQFCPSKFNLLAAIFGLTKI